MRSNRLPVSLSYPEYAPCTYVRMPAASFCCSFEGVPAHPCSSLLIPVGGVSDEHGPRHDPLAAEIEKALAVQASLRHELHVWSEIDHQIATADEMAHIHAAAVHVPDFVVPGIATVTKPPGFEPEPAVALSHPPTTRRLNQTFEPVPTVSDHPTGAPPAALRARFGVLLLCSCCALDSVS